jgi:GDP-L-fucose synthase
MTLLLTGSSGFIGSHINADIRWNSSDCDLTKREQVLDLLAEVRPESIIHCAGRHGSAAQMRSNHSGFLDDNVLMDLNVLYGANKLGIKNVLMVSSTTAFSVNAPLPLTEKALDFDSDQDYLGYSFSKRLTIRATEAYQKDFGANFKSVILGNTYGPGMRFAIDATVIGNLVSQMMQNREGGRPIVLFGDGSDKRNFTYVKDLDSIFQRLLEDESISGPVICSSQELVSISELAFKIASKVGYQGKIEFPGPRNQALRDKTVSAARLQELIGPLTFTPLEQGLQFTIESYMTA